MLSVVFNEGAKTRVLFAGFSMSIYYLAMWFVFLLHALIYGWRDIAYELIWLWLLWPSDSGTQQLLVPYYTERCFVQWLTFWLFV